MAGLLARCSADELGLLGEAVAARLEAICFEGFRQSEEYRKLLGQALVDGQDNRRGTWFEVPPIRLPGWGKGKSRSGASSGGGSRLEAALAEGGAGAEAPPEAADGAPLRATGRGAVSAELSHVTYLQAVKIKDEHLGQVGGRPHEMISLNEDRLIRIGKNADLRGRLQRHNARHLSRVYPRGTRFFSSNMSATDMSHALEMGCQMVALNFQTWDAAMQLNYALFRQNNGCGYVLRAPPPRRPPPAHPGRASPTPPASLSGAAPSLDRGFGVGGGGDEGGDASEADHGMLEGEVL